MNASKPKDQYERMGGLCAVCALPLSLNELGLCERCAAKLERDLIRGREWDYSETAFLPTDEQLETLRERILREYGADNELVVHEKPKPKNKHSRSVNTKRKRAIAAVAIRIYTTEDVVQAARRFLQAQPETWVNISRLAQHLHERFYHLKPKHLGQPARKYNSLLKFFADRPDFVIRRDPETGVYWIRQA